MADSTQSAVAIIQQQVKELDDLLDQANKDLNFAAAKERVLKWKARTTPLLAQHLGPKEAQRFAATEPGPSFTNDLLEELGDEADSYRSCLTALAKELKAKGGATG